MHKIKSWVIGNWKMNGTAEAARILAASVAKASAGAPGHVAVVVCPPAIFIPAVCDALQHTNVQVGGQDCHAEDSGAFTGNIAAPMLAQAGCAYVITGHSERRQFQHETSEEVAAKAFAAIRHGLVPVICVGETLKERESGKAMEVVGQQVLKSLPDGAKDDFILAYEPVWAIGSGLVPRPVDISQMHHHIRQVASARTGRKENEIQVLYGGSVKAANSREILVLDDVAGVLVGGASLNAAEFGGIIAAAAA
ncbi:MAG: triose-phosphate isomerase [Alphaproteobacteria bacterium]